MEWPSLASPLMDEASMLIWRHAPFTLINFKKTKIHVQAFLSTEFFLYVI